MLDRLIFLAILIPLLWLLYQVSEWIILVLLPEAWVPAFVLGLMVVFAIMILLGRNSGPR